MKDRDEPSHYSFDSDSSVREVADQQLDELLKLYEPPAPSLRLDQRVVVSYRAQHSHSAETPLWKRLLTTSVPVPAPLAAAVLPALIAAVGWAMYAQAASPALAVETIPPPPEIRVVEVPVVQEKIVTRTVYLRKNTDRSVTEGKPDVTRQHGSSLALFSSGAENGYVVQQSTDLRGFQPVPEMKIRVIRRNDTDEDQD